MTFSLSSLIRLSEAQWIVAGVSAVALVGGTAWATHHWDQGAYTKLQLADAQAQVAAVSKAASTQKALDNSGAKAAVSEGAAQQQIVTRTVTITKEVPTYVTVAQDQAAAAPGAHPGCISYGLVRVLDAQLLGHEPSDLALPAGQSDDSCSPLEPSALAEHLAADLGTAQQNAQQLDALLAELKRQQAILFPK